MLHTERDWTRAIGVRLYILYDLWSLCCRGFLWSASNWCWMVPRSCLKAFVIDFFPFCLHCIYLTNSVSPYCCCFCQFWINEYICCIYACPAGGIRLLFRGFILFDFLFKRVFVDVEKRKITLKTALCKICMLNFDFFLFLQELSCSNWLPSLNVHKVVLEQNFEKKH